MTLDELTDMMKVIVAFRNFTNALKKISLQDMPYADIMYCYYGVKICLLL